MIYYTELKNGRKSIYNKVIVDENGKELSHRTVEIPLYKIEKDKKIWFLLYDNDMKILSDPSSYLNFKMINESVTTRKNPTQALRLFYEYYHWLMVIFIK